MQQGDFINVFLARHVPSFWMGGGLESHRIGRVCGVDSAAPHTRPTQQLSRLPPIQKLVQKTICCNSTSNAPDDGRMCPKQVELRIHSLNHLVASSWHFKLFHRINASMCSGFMLKTSDTPME